MFTSRIRDFRILLTIKYRCELMRCSTVLDKYRTSTTGEVQTVLRVQVSTTDVIMSYRSSLDQSVQQLYILVNIPLRAWTHIALQVSDYTPINYIINYKICLSVSLKA